MRLKRIKGKRVSGFTLVEMAIVLVIIGIILAGIMKGRDIVRGSQVKQFSQGFAQKWVTIAATYMDKTGQALCDGADNGGQSASANGLMDGETFDESDTVVPATGNGVGSDLLQALRDVGITPCTMIKSDL
ncbi:MAG: prepilin-type N-terminal cleavage/methylation domain-containing protein, partial [Thermodesulfobacteriota bacterium]|nr:prepilin-type N-terminal cleavage/methylation domain-containing protein [Thermodesulfobacteriota bacterium]